MAPIAASEHGAKPGATSARPDTSSVSTFPVGRKNSTTRKEPAGLSNSRPKSAGSGKKTKTATLQAKADKLMSLYIRQKHAVNGMVKCVSCGKVIPWRESDCGHFIAKSRGASIRYVEEGVNPECRSCNRFDHNHLIGYTLYMIDTYGVEKIEELKSEARKTLSQREKLNLIEDAILYYGNGIRENNYEM